MAATQGIRSCLSAQPIPHSPKVRIYECLFLLNQKLQETVQILKQLEKCPWLRRDFWRSFQIEVEDLRAQTNFEVIEKKSAGSRDCRFGSASSLMKRSLPKRPVWKQNRRARESAGRKHGGRAQ